MYGKAPRPAEIEDVVVDVATMLLGQADDFWDCRTIQKELDKLVLAREEEVSDKLVNMLVFNLEAEFDGILSSCVIGWTIK